MDFDHDGQTDIVSGGYMGVPFFIKRSGKTWSKPVVLRDKAKKHLETGSLWDPDKKDHVDGQTPDGGKPDRAYAALPFDWDNDGDYDLIRGTSNGQLFLRMNEGTPKKASFARKTKFLGLTVPGGYAMPVAADWNGDGLIDLVSGAEDGAVYWFKNTGKPGTPKFTKAQQLLGSSASEKSGRGSYAQVEVCDWDQDGKLDLLVGDKHMHYDEKTGWDNHGYIWFYKRLK